MQKHSSEVTSKYTDAASLFNLFLLVCSFSRGSSYPARIQTEHHLYSDAIFLGRHKMQLLKTSSFEATLLSLKSSQGTCLSSYLSASMYNLWLTHLLIYSFVQMSLFQFSNIFSKLEMLKYPHRFLEAFSSSCSQISVSTLLINQLRSRLKL